MAYQRWHHTAASVPSHPLARPAQRCTCAERGSRASSSLKRAEPLFAWRCRQAGGRMRGTARQQSTEGAEEWPLEARPRGDVSRITWR
eukprot:2670290-Prymnesium_polylepis.2